MLNTINHTIINYNTISIEGMTTTEKMMDGLLYTVIGMGITFVVLIVIAFLIWSLKFVNRPVKKEGTLADPTNSNPVVENQQKEINLETSSNNIDTNVMDDKELVAVIMSAIAASLNTSTDNLIVKSIRKSRSKNY